METLKIIGRYSWRYAFLLATPILAGYGYHANNQYAVNLLVFQIYFCAVTAALFGLPLVSTQKSETTKKVLAINRVIPYWLDATSDVVALVIIVAYGHFWLATLWTWQLLLAGLVNNARTDLLKSNPQPTKGEPKNGNTQNAARQGVAAQGSETIH